ncbi:MAG: DNA cytosine methyltransferase [Spirochaetes bacterium]|nr:DNA cytosine methyltransferase [Spirochaetota bacterium]
MIPIIDIFAGPGGLGEGFSSFLNPETNEKEYKIALSIEKDSHAHQTLTLRSFYRQFNTEEIPSEYYEFLRGDITKDDLFNKYPLQTQAAKNEAWLAELGDNDKAISNILVDKKINEALKGRKDWLLIGGPPCQAYSIMGRARRQEEYLDEKKDEKVGLYKQYLRILAVHNPSVFIMENVKGLLSAKTKDNQIFTKILNDLSDPVEAYLSEFKENINDLNCPGYRIYSLVTKSTNLDDSGNPVFRQQDFVIKSEKYGIPQTRHRIILLGIRKNIKYQSDILKSQDEIPVSSILRGLPKIRSTLSRIDSNGIFWKKTISKIKENGALTSIDKEIKQEIIKQINKITLPKNKSGSEFLSHFNNNIGYRADWYLDEKIEGVCNHVSRGHMESDLRRYFFASCFAIVKKRSPNLDDFPSELLPAHKSVSTNTKEKKFTDRFSVQLWNKPSKTITSHISKDGHYYIHPDPTQCRSFTVREAARIQTFPDNYYFCGPRTAQFIQVGNAVPPLLANQIAGIVFSVFNTIQMKN